MTYTRLTPEFSAAAQIAPADAAEIAALGYRSILCNRPDGEDPGQPAFAEVAAAAAAERLAARHVPVVSGAITEADVERFRAAVAALPGPVFAYCRSGARCQTLWRLAL
jgi:sulfide:quinone oxidoreductase